jgi:hypothetical protein
MAPSVPHLLAGPPPVLPGWEWRPELGHAGSENASHQHIRVVRIERSLGMTGFASELLLVGELCQVHGYCCLPCCPCAGRWGCCRGCKAHPMSKTGHASAHMFLSTSRTRPMRVTGFLVPSPPASPPPVPSLPNQQPAWKPNQASLAGRGCASA